MEGDNFIYIASGDGALPVVPEISYGLRVARLIDSRWGASGDCDYSQHDRDPDPACRTHSAPPRQG
jgi:hypothetical protein